VLTGSFNWTYTASNRKNRENLIVIQDAPSIIQEFSQEFMHLKTSAKQLQKEPAIVTVTKEVEKIVKIGSFSKYNAYSTHEGIKLCGKCHFQIEKISGTFIERVGSLPRKVKTARYYCKDCGAYFDEGLKYL
jgi:uncharacterized protein with PIN domain